MHQNYFLTSKSTLNARGADPSMRKFYPPSNVNYYKGSVQTEPDQDIREEKNDFRYQKGHCVTEEDETPRSRYIPIKPKSLSINATPRLNGLRALQFTPNNEIGKHGQIHDMKYKPIHRAAQSESLNPFDIFMKRLTKLQHTSELPNPEPVKHSEKSYGTIKAFGICTNQGLIRTYNEDRVSIILNIVKPDEPNAPPCSIFSLFDGHGGSKCADFLRNNLHNNIVKSKHFPSNIQEALRDAFDETEKLFIEESLVNPVGIYEKSGSCALVMVIIEDTCYICNLGDSRAVMSQDFGKSVFALTRDHKPNDKLEQKRIVAGGGRIYQNPVAPTDQFLGLDVDITLQRQAPPFRILPGKLSVSRAFGDIEAKLPQLGGNPNVLIAKPEITKLKLSDNHDFILLGCDGIFDRLSNEEVVQSIWDTLNKKQASSIHEMLGTVAENTIRAALLSKSFDNVTAIIVTFGNFETVFNQKKDTQMKANTSRLEPSLIMSKSNFKNPNIISGLNIASSLNKSPSFSIVNFPGPDRSLAYKKEPQVFEPIFEKKADPKADFGSKRHLPNIKNVVKRGPTPQTSYK